MRETGAASRAKALHTSVQWDGLTAVNGAAEKMTHLIINRLEIDNAELSALKQLTPGKKSPEDSCLGLAQK